MILRLVAVPELWEFIAQCLAPTDLLHLSSVSRAFNAITERYLYRKIVLTWNHSKPDSSTPIQQLFLNLLHRPELASYIREFSVHEIEYGPKPRVRHAASNSLKNANVVVRSLLQEMGYRVRKIGSRDFSTWKWRQSSLLLYCSCGM